METIACNSEINTACKAFVYSQLFTGKWILYFIPRKVNMAPACKICFTTNSRNQDCPVWHQVHHHTLDQAAVGHDDQTSANFLPPQCFLGGIVQGYTWHPSDSWSCITNTVTSIHVLFAQSDIVECGTLKVFDNVPSHLSLVLVSRTRSIDLDTVWWY